jgi:hypothetical protein
MNFSQTIDEVKRQQHEASPVVQAQKHLAPIRAALVAGLKDFQKRMPTLAQIFGAAEVRRQQAASINVTHARLTYILQEVLGHEMVRGLLHSIEPDYDQTIGRMDQLTEMDLNFPNVMKGLPNEPNRLRSLVAHLDSRAAEVQRLTRDGGELDQMVKRAAGQPPATMTTGTLPEQEPRTEIMVESQFSV